MSSPRQPTRERLCHLDTKGCDALGVRHGPAGSASSVRARRLASLPTSEYRSSAAAAVDGTVAGSVCTGEMVRKKKSVSGTVLLSKDVCGDRTEGRA